MRTRDTALLACLVVVGCTPLTVSSSASDSEDAAEPVPEPGPDPWPPEESDTGEDEDEDDEGSDFLTDMDMPPELEWCDFWAQDACPPGEKCQAIASTPGSGAWDANVCVPAGHDKVGETCCLAGVGNCPIVGPPGTDSCDATSICFDVDVDTLLGTCAEYCVGPSSSASCPQTGGWCNTLAGGVLNWCDAPCDPFDPDRCDAYTSCLAEFGYPDDEFEGFRCRWTVADDATEVGSECALSEYGVPGCAEGLFCREQALVGSTCDYEWCCTELCALDDVEFTCQGIDQQCLPLPDTTPQNYAHVGQCRVPEEP